MSTTTSGQATLRHSQQRLPRRDGSLRLGLVVGFTAQLLLILIVTVVGLNELEKHSTQLQSTVQGHMQRMALTKTMQTAARDRTMSLVRMITLTDPFDHDEEQLRFAQHATVFMDARRNLMALPLSEQELTLLEQQWSHTRRAIPYQNQVIELSRAGHVLEAQKVLIERAVPAQNAVMKTLAQLDDITRSTTLQSIAAAESAHGRARNWIISLGSIALLVGILIAAVVIRHIHRISLERERLASLDPLTGLPNRVLLLDRIDQAILRAQRQKNHVGLMFIDLDGFKDVNDTFGHLAGDELLKQIAEHLRATVRAGDIVARLGGDEFIIGVLDAASIDYMQTVADKILHAIHQPVLIAGQLVTISASIGIAVFPEHGDNAEALLKCADAAMYAAKEAGKNRVSYCQPG